MQASVACCVAHSNNQNAQLKLALQSPGIYTFTAYSMQWHQPVLACTAHTVSPTHTSKRMGILQHHSLGPNHSGLGHVH